jgi:hypothetical protein
MVSISYMYLSVQDKAQTIPVIRLAIAGRCLNILDNRTDPYLKHALDCRDGQKRWDSSNRSKSHILNIIKLLDQTLPRTAAVIVHITGGCCRTIDPSKAICKDLVD